MEGRSSWDSYDVVARALGKSLLSIGSCKAGREMKTNFHGNAFVNLVTSSWVLTHSSYLTPVWLPLYGGPLERYCVSTWQGWQGWKH